VAVRVAAGAVAGGGWTARVGLTGDVGPLRAAVVVGDAGWWLGDGGPAQTGPALVTPPRAPGFVRATLALSLAVVGVPATSAGAWQGEAAFKTRLPWRGRSPGWSLAR